MPGQWTPEEEDQLQELYRAGTSIRAIGRQMGRTAPAIRGKLDRMGLDRTHKAREGRAIAVISTKGGVGKSTVSIGLAQGLAKLGWRTGYLDLDLDSPCGHILAGAKRPTSGNESLVPVESNGVRCISLGASLDDHLAPHMHEEWKGQVIASMMRSIDWSGTNLLILDMPPGAPVELRWFVEHDLRPHGAIIVTQPQRVSSSAARRCVSLMQEYEVPIIGVVENMSGDIFGSGGGGLLARLVDEELLGCIPLSSEITTACDRGAMLPGTPFAVLCERVHKWLGGTKRRQVLSVRGNDG